MDVKLVANTDTTLDERQQRHVDAAAQKSLRIGMLALLAAYIVVSFRTDDLVITASIAAVGFAIMGANAYYLRRAGVDRELEDLRYVERAKRGLLTAQSVRMFAIFLLLGIARSFAEDSLSPAHILTTVVGALFGAFVYSLGELYLARRRQRLIEAGRESADFERGWRLGHRLGAWLRRMTRG